MKFLGPLLIIICAFGIFYWYIDPAYYAILQLRDNSTALEQTIAQAQAAQNKLTSLTSQYNNFNSTDLDRLQKTIPSKADSISLIIDLTALAKKYGTQIQDISVPNQNTNAVANDGGNTALAYTTVPISFTVPLTYQNFFTFLNGVEQNLRIMDVSSIAFTPDDKTGLYKYSMTINTYALNH